MYTVELSDGTKLQHLEGDWDDLISTQEITEGTFAGKLAPVSVIEEDVPYLSSMVWDKAKVVYIRHFEDGWHFRLDAITEQDEAIARLTAENEMLTECLLEISELIYGGE